MAGIPRSVRPVRPRLPSHRGGPRRPPAPARVRGKDVETPAWRPGRNATAVPRRDQARKDNRRLRASLSCTSRIMRSAYRGRHSDTTGHNAWHGDRAAHAPHRRPVRRTPASPGSRAATEPDDGPDTLAGAAGAGGGDSAGRVVLARPRRPPRRLRTARPLGTTDL